MYTFFWRDRKTSMRLIETYMRCFLDNGIVMARVIDDIFIFSDHLEQNCYVNSRNLDLAAQKGRLYFNKRFIRNLFLKIDRDIRDFWKFTFNLSRLSPSKISEGQLVGSLKRFNRLTSNILTYFLISQAEFFYKIEERFRNLLRQKVDNYTAEKHLATLITPTSFDKAMLSRFDWQKILARKKVTEKTLLKYIEKYPALFFPAVWSKKKAINILSEKLKDEKKQIKILKQDNGKLLREKRVLRNRQTVILKNYSAKIKFLSHVLQGWGIRRFEIKFCWAGSELILSDFLQEIAKRSNVPLRDLMFVYKEDEIERALKCGKTLSCQEVKNRYSYYLYGIRKGKITFLSGRKAYLETRKLAPAEKKEIKELKGQIANPGEIKGVVHVVSIGNLKEMDKFQKGEILVTPMTQPNMVPIAQKAGAIVTDEGGIISHAAIISREFNIPCIVGTKIATKVLKNGDKVLVDANKGIVKKL